MDDDLKRQIIGKYIESAAGHKNLSVETAKTIISHLRPQWIPAPEGTVCPRCASAMERTVSLSVSRFAGSVRCTSCDYRDSASRFILSQIVKVEPMPPGALPVYYNDPGVAEIVTGDE